MKILHVLLITFILNIFLLPLTKSSAESNISSTENISANTSISLPTTQFDPFFPDQTPSSRNLINEKRVFQAYKGQGSISIKNNNATTAILSINNNIIEINNLLRSNPQGSFSIDISNYTINGENTLSLTQIQPQNAKIILTISYPTLTLGKPSDVKMNNDKLSLVDNFINNEVQKGFPGAVLLIVKDGKIIKETAYGFARKYNDDGTLMQIPQTMKTDTLFDLASNSKIFATTFAIMQLASQGKIDINKPITNYLPNYKTWGREQRKIKQLLTHSAGYESEIMTYKPDNKYGLEAYSLTRLKTIRYLVEKAPLVYDQETKNLYSDTDFLLLGILVETITNMPLDAYLEENIYKPLKLTHTLFNPLQKGFKPEQCAATEIFGNTRGKQILFPEIRKTVLQGTVHDEKAWYSMGGVAGHAGLFSTARDLAVLCQIILNKGGYGSTKLFSQNIVDQFSKPSDTDITFGFGWRRQGNQNLKWHFGSYASNLAIGHTGWTGTCTVIDPKYNLAIILLTNKKHSLNKPESTDFYGDDFQTGQYGSIVQMVYEAMSLK